MSYKGFASSAKNLTEQDIKKFWSFISCPGPKPCWLWKQGGHTFGYGSIQFRGERHLAHRLAWCLTHGDIPEGKHVCHKCDTPQCCNPSHLFIGTAKDNQDDCTIKRRRPRGGTHGMSKLTDEKVREIRCLHAQGVPLITISKQFGVGSSNLIFIVRRQTWTHVSD